MQERHVNKERYFKEQGITTAKYVIPYLSDQVNINANTRVLEIGCGEGGNLVPFLDMGCEVVGIDITPSRIELAQKYLANHPNKDKLKLIAADIYTRTGQDGKFDLIIMRDVIEHIHDQDRFMVFVQMFMHKTTRFFLAFPPWYNPFGGHQQICKNRFLSKLPFYHILPSGIYKIILRLGKESPQTIADLIEIKETGISLERFEKIAKKHRFHIDKKTWYFINPNYDTKFGIKPKVQWQIFTFLPFIRNFTVTAGYYILSVQSAEK